MLRRISTSEYMIWFVAMGIYMAAIVFLFPFFLRWAVLAMAGGSCAGAGGACGALAAVLGVYVKPLLVLVAIVAYTLAAFKRMRGEFSPFWVVFAGALIFASAPHLYALGNFWGANFSVGILALSIPFTLLAALLFGILLTIDIEEAPGYGGSLVDVTGPYGLPSGKLYAATAIWLLGCVGVSLLIFVAARMGLLGAVMVLLKPLYASGLHWLLSTQIPAALNVLAGILLIAGLFTGDEQGGRSRNTPRTPSPGSPSPGTSSPRPGATASHGPARGTFGRRNA